MTDINKKWNEPPSAILENILKKSGGKLTDENIDEYLEAYFFREHDETFLPDSNIEWNRMWRIREHRRKKIAEIEEARAKNETDN